VQLEQEFDEALTRSDRGRLSGKRGEVWGAVRPERAQEESLLRAGALQERSVGHAELLPDERH